MSIAAKGPRLYLSDGRHELVVDDAGGALREAASLCSQRGATVDELVGVARSAGLELAALALAVLLRRCAGLGWLRYAVLDAGVPSLRAEPDVPRPQPEWVEARLDVPYALSRFAYCHREGTALAVRSPRSRFTVTVPAPRLASLIARLADPCDVATLAAECDVAVGTAGDAVSLLAGVGLVHEVGVDGADEDLDPVVRQWELHDLLFHTSSREGRHARGVGATYRFRGDIGPLRAVPAPGGGELVPLPVPASRSTAPVPFVDVLEARRSVREHGPRPIGRDELGELLHRSARIREVVRIDGDEVCRRPFPSAGALHELELYLVVDRCADLVPGMYHYRALEHGLERISARTGHVDALLAHASFAAAMSGPPQLLVVISARFQRIAWKYESIAYSLMLKNVGCLIQTIYLTATALGLAPCAIGSGNAETFAAAVGRPPEVEGSVGEMILGTLPEASSR